MTTLSLKRLRPYQSEVALAILDSVFGRKGLTFSVEIARQGGKNELSAQLELLLLTLYMAEPLNLIKCAPTFKPQTVISMMRLKDRLNDAGFGGIWAAELGYTIRLGNARAIFLSADESANVVGNTAHILLEIDEAQDVGREKYSKEFKPMGATTNVTSLYKTVPPMEYPLLCRCTDSLLDKQNKGYNGGMGMRGTTAISAEKRELLLRDLVDSRFWHSDEGIFADPQLQPYVRASYVLIVTSWFKSDADKERMDCLHQCEQEYAAGLCSLIRKGISPLAMLSKGYRLDMQIKIIEKTMGNLFPMAEEYILKNGHILQDVFQPWVSKWIRPKIETFENSQLMVDLLSVIAVQKTVAVPLVENPPPGFTKRAIMKDGQPSPEWLQLVQALTKLGAVDPGAWQALRNPEVCKALGLSRDEARAIIRDNKTTLKEPEQDYKVHLEESLLKGAYCFMRVRIDGITEQAISHELRQLAAYHYEEALEELAKYKQGNDSYDIRQAYLDRVPERILIQLFPKKVIELAARANIINVYPRSKPNFPTRRHISDQWLPPFDKDLGYESKPGRPRTRTNRT